MNTIPLIMTNNREAIDIIAEMKKSVESLKYLNDGTGICGILVTFADGGQCVVLYSDSFRRIH